MTRYIKLEIVDGDIDDVVLGYHKDDELHELATLEPPVAAELRRANE